MDALLILGMLATLIAGCFWFVLTLPKQEPTYCDRCMSAAEVEALLTQGRHGARGRHAFRPEREQHQDQDEPSERGSRRSTTGG